MARDLEAVAAKLREMGQTVLAPRGWTMVRIGPGIGARVVSIAPDGVLFVDGKSERGLRGRHARDAARLAILDALDGVQRETPEQAEARIRARVLGEVEAMLRAGASSDGWRYAADAVRDLGLAGDGS